MKIVSLLAVLFFSSPTFAAPDVPLPAAGTYSYQGSFEVKMKLHYEVVYAFTPDGAAKLEQLRKEKYECWHKMRQTWLCKQFQSVDGAADVIRSRVEAELAGRTLVLGERFGEPSLISKGEDVAEYKVIQKATYGEKSWDDYRLFMSRGDWSIRMGDPTEEQWALNAGVLSKWEQTSVTESKTAYTIYLYEAAFPKVTASVLAPNRMYVCKFDNIAERAAYFISVDPTGSRLVDFHFEGETREDYDVTKVAQFRYEPTMGEASSFYVQYFLDATTGFSVEFSGEGVRKGVYKNIITTPNGPSLEGELPLSCSRIL